MQKERKKKINIFDYTDYRKYLADFYLFQKQTNPAFSYRYFAQKAGISSSGFYKELIDGKRSLGRSLILKFSKAIKHTKKEAEFFENMVYFSEATTIEERSLYFKKMMASYESKVYRLLADQYEYFSKWYYIVIRELLCFTRFKDDYKALANLVSPTIREEQARKGIEVLEKLQLISRDKEGFYIQAEPLVTTGKIHDDKRLDLLNIINFQKSMLGMMLEAYDRYPVQKMDMSTLTLSVSQETFLAMKEEIASLRKKLLGMAEKDESPDRIYQLCYGLFPMTKES